MGYKLAAVHGDTLAVPQIVVSHLKQADGDTVRVALYLLKTGSTDPRTIAKELGLPSLEAARRALLYWAGAGLLESTDSKAAAPREGSADNPIDLASLTDPYVAVLCEEAQTLFGRALGRSELQRLVALYLSDGWQPDVLLLCCSEVARQGRHTVAALARELGVWRSQNVETGEDAEQYLKRQKRREEYCAETAAQFGIAPAALTRWERGAIARWYEENQVTPDLVEEALLRAGSHRTVRYVDGILRGWRAQGITTAAAARGQGQLSGSNILATERPTAPAATTGQQPFQNDWDSIFDEEV